MTFVRLALTLSLLIAAALTMRAAPLLVNPDFNNNGEGWQLGDATTIQMLPGTGGGIDLATLHPATGGYLQCVPITSLPSGIDLSGTFTVTPQQNMGGIRGLLSFFSQPACAGPVIQTTNMEPPVDTRTDATGTPVQVSGKATIPVGAQSVRFWMLAYHLVPTIAFVFNLKNPSLETPDSPPPPPNAPDLEIILENRAGRAGDRYTLDLAVINHGSGPTSGPITITVRAPPGFRLACTDLGADCSGTGTRELVITQTAPLEANGIIGFELIFDSENASPGDQDFVYSVFTEGDADLEDNLFSRRVMVPPPRQGARVPESSTQQVNGRGRAQ
jgi:hypothetical protein